MTNIKFMLTPRGFVRGDFTDLYGWKCSIQESSLATQDALWLGCDETPDGEKLGPIDKISGQHIGSRMHLDVALAKELIGLLQYFVDHGNLPNPEPDQNEV